MSIPREFTVESDSSAGIVIDGCVADGKPDEDGQILDPDWFFRAAWEWVELGTGITLRGQHAGQGTLVRAGEDGGIWLRSLITSADGKARIRDGTSRAYGVGIDRPFVVLDPDAPMGRIADGQLTAVFLDCPQ